jgi:hypothetical protein
MTKPSRRASKGLEACSGSALLSVVARMVSKQAIEIGEIGASLAPASTDVGVAVLDQLAAVADRVDARRAAGGDTTVPGPAPGSARHLGGRAAGHEGLVQEPRGRSAGRPASACRRR